METSTPIDSDESL